MLRKMEWSFLAEIPHTGLGCSGDECQEQRRCAGVRAPFWCPALPRLLANARIFQGFPLANWETTSTHQALFPLLQHLAKEKVLNITLSMGGLKMNYECKHDICEKARLYCFVCIFIFLNCWFLLCLWAYHRSLGKPPLNLSFRPPLPAIL